MKRHGLKNKIHLMEYFFSSMSDIERESGVNIGTLPISE
jgi:hypothetical protein